MRFRHSHVRILGVVFHHFAIFGIHTDHTVRDENRFPQNLKLNPLEITSNTTSVKKCLSTGYFSMDFQNISQICRRFSSPYCTCIKMGQIIQPTFMLFIGVKQANQSGQKKT